MTCVDVAYKYQSALSTDVVGGKLSQIRIRRSLERVNEEIEERNMAEVCEEEVKSMHKWLVTWFRGEFVAKDTELATFKARFHPRFKYGRNPPLATANLLEVTDGLRRPR